MDSKAQQDHRDCCPTHMGGDVVESEDLIISFIWLFAIIISVLLFWIGESYVAGIGGPYIASGLLFFIALIASAAILLQKSK